MKRCASISIMSIALISALMPINASAIVVVDLLAESRLLTQVEQQIKQIQQMATALSDNATNLRTFANAGAWTNLAGRLQNIQQVIRDAKASSQIGGSVADAQISQMQQEINAINKMATLANTSRGSLEAQQAQARIQVEIVSQLHELRQIQLAAMKQAQIEQKQAVDDYHSDAPDPTQP